MNDSLGLGNYFNNPDDTAALGASIGTPAASAAGSAAGSSLLGPIGAGVGVLTGLLSAAQQKKQNLARAGENAAAIRYAPFTKQNVSGLMGQDYGAQNPYSAALGGALSGYQTGANINNAAINSAYNRAASDYYTKNNLSPYSGIGNT